MVSPFVEAALRAQSKGDDHGTRRHRSWREGITNLRSKSGGDDPLGAADEDGHAQEVDDWKAPEQDRDGDLHGVLLDCGRCDDSRSSSACGAGTPGEVPWGGSARGED